MSIFGGVLGAIRGEYQLKTKPRFGTLQISPSINHRPRWPISSISSSTFGKEKDGRINSIHGERRRNKRRSSNRGSAACLHIMLETLQLSG